MIEDDDYPPYPPVAYQDLERRVRTAQPERDRLVMVIAGVIAGIAAGALLVVYGIF